MRMPQAGNLGSGCRAEFQCKPTINNYDYFAGSQNVAVTRLDPLW